LSRAANKEEGRHPTAIIFVPCVGGISHNEIEDAKPAYLTAGCNVLLSAVLDRANAASPREGHDEHHS
jgi:N-carbamoyl-L-amino-acid hydrolase